MPSLPTRTPSRPAATAEARTAPPWTWAPERRRQGSAPAVLLAAALAAALAAGCGGGERARQNSAESAAVARAIAAADSVTAAAAGDTTACPKDGAWHPCSVTERLKRAGLATHVESDSARLPFLTPTGQVWRVARVELRLFLYDDAARAAREAQALDRIRVAPRGESYAWPAPPTLVHSANLVAVLLSENPRQTERVQLALEAGPPQPEQPPEAQQLPPAPVR